MTYRYDSLFLSLMQTMLISSAGFLLVDSLARGSAMSNGALLIGPLAVALMWLGLQQIEKPSKKMQQLGRE
ncbi:MAG TPA: hypothetical protein VN700_06605 [Vicinamibacterales bacterium]|nr:hypothetical protein [Vicinamibacterales bacterium]